MTNIDNRDRIGTKSPGNTKTTKPFTHINIVITVRPIILFIESISPNTRVTRTRLVLEVHKITLKSIDLMQESLLLDLNRELMLRIRLGDLITMFHVEPFKDQ